MEGKKLVAITLLLGIFLLVFPNDVSASSQGTKEQTEVGISILKSDVTPIPPEPIPPSPTIHKDVVINHGRLPKTGELVSYLWVLSGSVLLILIGVITFNRLFQQNREKRAI